MIADGDADFQGAKIGLLLPALEAADTLVDERQEIGDAIRDRSVRRDRAFLALSPHLRRVAAAKCALGFRDDIAQQVELVRTRRTPAEDHLHEFLKPHQPERQVERFGVDHHRMLRECGGELVVRVENENA